jgi:hypothetical protein
MRSTLGWREGRWIDGLVPALLVQGVMIVALGIAVGRRGALVLRPSRVAVREHLERLRFVAPVIPAPTRPRGDVGGGKVLRRLSGDVPRAPVAPARADTAAQMVVGPAASVPAVASARAVVSAAAGLASPLGVDSRLRVVPEVADNAAAARVRDVNAAIASSVRALGDSVARARRRWTLGVDATHRFGIASCGIVVDVICIPFGVGSMPNPATTGTGIDLKHAADEAEVRAAIARIRGRDSVPGDRSLGRSGP